MKISINSIKGLNQRYSCASDIAPHGTDELLVKIGAQLGGIDETEDIGKKYDGVIIVTIVSCQKHPNADKLNICTIDDGGVITDVARDADGYVQVVCGAPNVREGLVVAWLPPGSTVPSSVGSDPFVLSARELRGVISNGMLASPKELSIGDSHEGIMELSADIQPGTNFARHFDLEGDLIVDIENKMFTHRPDCFGFMGVSREIAGIQGIPFSSPDWYKTDAEIPAIETNLLPLTVRNELPDQVKRFCAITMGDIKVGPSPDWLQVELAKVGQRPINSIVDLTNFFMLETGQPLHAYDYDKVRALDESDSATLVVRYPHEDEKITLLNGKEIEPRPEAIMIATERTLIGVGGVMGGADTEVDENTTNIIIEVANFDMYSIRRTSMAHGLFTDAVSRFNKGQSPLQNRAIIAKMIDDVRKLGGKVAGELVDDIHLDEKVLTQNSLYDSISITPEFINKRLGLDLSVEQISALLTNVEFEVTTQNEALLITAPFWRTDIEIPEDIVEEVGRLYGFDHLPLSLPQRDLTPIVKDSLIELKSRVRTILAKAGANEVLTYSFVHGKLLEKTGQDPLQAFKLSNALSPDLQYYRLSLTPSLLDKIHANVKAGNDEFALFEIGKAHGKSEIDEDGVPAEFNRLALVFAAEEKVAKQRYAGSAYYEARQYLDLLVNGDAPVQFIPLTEAAFDSHLLTEQMTKPYEPQRSAVILIAGQIVGIVGEFTVATRKALKLPAYSAGFEVFISAVANANQTYVQMPRFPKLEQDICFKVSAGTTYMQLYELVSEALKSGELDQTYYTIKPVDIYQRSDDVEHKQITLRLSIASYQKTLRDAEVTALLDAVSKIAQVKLGAERV